MVPCNPSEEAKMKFVFKWKPLLKLKQKILLIFDVLKMVYMENPWKAIRYAYRSHPLALSAVTAFLDGYRLAMLSRLSRSISSMWNVDFEDQIELMILNGICMYL